MVVAGGGALAGMRRVVGVVLQIARVGRSGGGGGLAEMIGGAAAREVVEPRGEGAFVAVGVAVFEDALKHGLGDVLGGGAVARELDEEAVERAMVALEELAERVEVAVAHGEHQGVIRERSDGFHGSDAGNVSHRWAGRNAEIWSGGGHGVGEALQDVPRETAATRKGYRKSFLRLHPAIRSRKLFGMNRRDFLVRSSLFASAGLLIRPTLLAQSSASAPTAKPAAATTPPPAVTEFRPLRRDVGIFTGRGGTIGWLASRDALVVVDTQFPDTAATCLAGLPGRGARTLDVVLNTHHHADHTSGNGVFKAAAKSIVAHANVPKLQFAAAEKAGSLTSQVYADTTFPTVWRRELGDEIVTAQYHGPAHTSGDVVVHFERANVVHLGDIGFNRLYPVIDRPAGATIRGWIKVIEEIVRDYPKDAIYVFGHGSKKFGVTGERGELLVLRDYFSALLAHVQKQIAAGREKEQIVALDNLAGFPDFHTPLPNRLGLNLSVAYDELTEPRA